MQIQFILFCLLVKHSKFPFQIFIIFETFNSFPFTIPKAIETFILVFSHNIENRLICREYQSTHSSTSTKGRKYYRKKRGISKHIISMINQKVETACNNSDYAEFESVSETEDSVSVQQENRGRLESMKRLKKVRSIRFHRLSTRRGKPQQEENLSILSSIGTESSEKQTPFEIISDSSPHYMKGTSSSHAKESFQNTKGIFTKTLTRVSTLKLKRSLTRKNDQKRKLKSSRSIKIGNFKGPKLTRKVSESIHSSDAYNKKSSSFDDGNKPQRAITRRLSFKPMRILSKISTFRSKNSTSQSSDPSLHRPTCSSTLKDSHFPDQIELPQDESGSSQVVSTMKICPYTYCSLHGHRRHDDLPPLKRFVSMRRRQMKTQKSKKTDGGPVGRSKQPGNARKTSQKTRNFDGENDASQNVKNLASDPSKGSTLAEGEEKYNFRYDMIDFEKLVSVEVVNSSASHIGILEGEVDIEGENMEGDFEAMQMDSAQKEAEPASTANVLNRMPERDDRYMTMWNLVYKNAVLANTAKEESKLPFDGKEAHSFDADDENKSLIDMVQKAFDEILLPEPEEFTSRGVGSDEELSEKGEDKSREENISASRESSQEESLPKDVNLRSNAEDMTAQRMESKPDSRTPKSWSNLKKILVLRRFVKAMEKARKLNFRWPRYLPLDADFEAGKVSLKHQTADEKRSAEEWMLDYALQKVISKLAPAQRQRVSLLVEAFETIRPFQDSQNSSPRLSSITMGNQANPFQPPYDSSDHGKQETDKDNVSNNSMPELHNTVKEELNSKQSLACSYDDEEKRLDCNDDFHLTEIKDSGSRSVENISRFHDEAPTNGIVNEVPTELVSNSITGNFASQSEPSGGDFETGNEIGANSEQFSLSKSLILKGLARSLGTSLVGSGGPSGSLDEAGKTEERKERIEKANPINIPAHGQSKAPIGAIVDSETQQEKQNHTGLWYLVYKHMVSDLAENDSTKSQSDRENETVSENESRSIRETSVPYESTHVINQGLADPEVEQQRIEAIKMVEEAIDSIIPDVQDYTPDRQLFTDNKISENTKQSSRNESVNSEGINRKEEKEEEGASKDGNKPKKQLSRSWSNLKKVILLRRFIKALEKVRKFNPRGPRYLPIEADAEAEKVNLRHQDMADRKGTEEWMLDYALRQVVSKLTPERKRKVELLVEAFETVTPTIRN